MQQIIAMPDAEGEYDIRLKLSDVLIKGWSDRCILHGEQRCANQRLRGQSQLAGVYGLEQLLRRVDWPPCKRGESRDQQPTNSHGRESVPLVPDWQQAPAGHSVRQHLLIDRPKLECPIPQGSHECGGRGQEQHREKPAVIDNVAQ